MTTTLPAGLRTKPVDCGYTGSGLTKAPVRVRDCASVGAEADWEGQAVLGDEIGGSGFVVDRQGSDLGANVSSHQGVALGRPVHVRRIPAGAHRQDC